MGMLKPLILARRGRIPRMLALACAIMLGMAAAAPTARCQENAAAKVTAAFRDECEKLLVEKIDAAGKEIQVAVYTFTNRRIADALAAAAGRGVTVQVKLDKAQAEQEFSTRLVDSLRRAKISVRLIEMPDGYHMHHKFIVVDGRLVVTGSYNFTVAATRENWENVVCIESEKVAAAFAAEWRTLKSRKQ